MIHWYTGKKSAWIWRYQWESPPKVGTRPKLEGPRPHGPARGRQSPSVSAPQPPLVPATWSLAAAFAIWMATTSVVLGTSHAAGLRVAISRSPLSASRWDEGGQAALVNGLSVMGWRLLDADSTIRSLDVQADLRAALGDPNLVLDATDAIMFVEPAACHLQVRHG
jgi:hypothetical protein